MTTRIAESSTPHVKATPTAARVTPPPSRPFQSVMRAGSQVVVSGAEGAVRRLPGGPVLAAAFRSGPANGPVAPEQSAEGPAGTSEPSPVLGSGSPDGTGDLENVMAHQAEQNLYYLQLQQRISAESREYTAVSNVLKARHETVKNAIGNIR